MLLKLTCPACDHVGLTYWNPAALDGVLACGDVSLVEKGERIRNAAFFTEWLLGSGDAELVDTAAPGGR